MQPKIAVLMCVYCGDQLEYLKLSVESILQQSYQNYTFFILADGKLPHYMNNYLNSLSINKVIIRHRDKNMGLAKSLNELIDLVLSSGDYDLFARMDADDISDSQRFETQVNFLNNHTEVDVVGSWYNEIDSNGILKGTIKLPTSHEQLIPFMARRSPFAHPSVMIRAQIFNQGYRYNSSYRFMQDYDLWVRLASAKFIFANIPKCLLNFRSDNNFFNRRASLERAVNNSMTSFRHIRNFKLYSLGYIFSPVLLFFLRLAPPVLSRFAYRNFRNR